MPPPTPVMQTPSAAREVRGSVLGFEGQPLGGVTVRAIGFNTGQTAPEVVTGDSGEFSLTGLLDANTLLQIEAPGFYSEVVPAFLQGQDEVIQLEPVALLARQPGRARLWIAGDLMFARRFEDKDEDGVVGEPDDLIRPDQREDDAYRLFRYILPALSSADYRTANFESPASTAHDSRHPYKEFSFTSHPETLGALRRAGIEAVSLGNNHSYDYLEAGRAETASALREHGIAFFGSGENETDARESLLKVTINDVPLSFQGFDGIKPATFYPDPNQPWSSRFFYYAMNDPPKGGALLLDEANLADFMSRDTDRLRIPVMHGGDEYGDTPSVVMRDRFEQVHQAGAKLVAAHHSHTVYGVTLWGPVEDPSVSLLSLGNFIFDQDVFETFNSFMAVADVDKVNEGYQLRQLRLIPFHQENYLPSLISGEQAERLARHVGHISTFLPEREEDTLRPAVSFVGPTGIGVMLRPEDYREEVRTAERSASMVDGESDIFSLNAGSTAADYFVSYQPRDPELAGGVSLRLARDLLIYGDFEDYDLDEGIGENDNWWQTSTRYPTTDQARSGRHSLALYRAQGARGTVNTQLRNRLSFAAGTELSLGCHFMGVNAGSVTVVAQYIQRDTRDFIGEETLMTWEAGSYGWTEHHAPLSPPAAAGHLRFVITMQPTGTGGALYVDDCTLLAWGPRLAPGEVLPTPHGYDWARFEAPSSGELAYSEERRVYRRVYAPR